MLSSSRRLTINLAVGLVYQLVVLLANFLTKQAIRYQLGTDYLGLQTVYANICDVLVFAFGGLGLAMVYRLYGAFDRGDEERQATVFQHFSALYRKVTWGAVAVGLLSFGIVLWSVDVPIALAEIACAYALYLPGVVFDARYRPYYFFLLADQRRYVACLTLSFAEMTCTMAGVWALRAGCPYAVFLACLLAKNAFCAAVLAAYMRKRYPYLARRRGGIDGELREQVKRDVRDSIVSRAGITLVSSTDSIIISGLVGTVVAGCFSGYYFITAGITLVVSGIFEPLMSHVGKLQSHADRGQVFASFIRMYGVCMCLTGVCVSGFYWLADDFIVLWMGRETLLPHAVLVACAVNLHMGLFHQNVSAFRLSAGLFAGVSGMTLLRGVLNVAVSFALGYPFGLVGILAATALCDLATLYWYEPFVLYRHLSRPLLVELGFQVGGVLLALCCVAVGGLVAGWWGACASWGSFAVKTLLVGGASCLVCLPVVGLSLRAAR